MPLLRFLPEATKVNFVGVRYIAFAIDGLLLLISIVSIAYQGFNLGIDFTGGVLMEVKSERTIDLGQIRKDMTELGFKDAQIQTISGEGCKVPNDSCVQIRVQPDAKHPTQTIAGSIRARLSKEFPCPPKTCIRRNEAVGPTVSGELFHAGVYATLFAIIAIAFWVAIRFEWQYGIGAAIATGHDVLVTAGMFSVFHLDFTLTSIAALLTLAGYSINDTVVVFDRLRENRRKYKRMPLRDLINLSTNQMLTRTILTSVATAMSIIPLLVYGGPNLFDFSAPILFGIVVGTFSSIYVAAMLLLYLPAPAGAVDDGGTAAAVEA